MFRVRPVVPEVDSTRGFRALAVAATIALSALALVSPAHASHASALWWDDDLNVKRQYGPNQTVAIRTGIMEYWAICLPGGTTDFVFPWTDIYVMKAGEALSVERALRNGGVLKLSDVNDKPNAVESISLSGVFIDAVLGFTKPAGS